MIREEKKILRHLYQSLFHYAFHIEILKKIYQNGSKNLILRNSMNGISVVSH